MLNMNKKTRWEGIDDVKFNNKERCKKRSILSIKMISEIFREYENWKLPALWKQKFFKCAKRGVSKKR